MGQVGCVYTAQGFEYDFAGVLLGPDLVWRDGDWVAVRSGNKDPALRSRTAVSDDHFDALVRNIYKVLLTRGMQGVGIHSVDPETNEPCQPGAAVDQGLTSITPWAPRSASTITWLTTG